MKTKFKATICGVALLILGLVMQAAAVSKIGFLDPYWMLRHLQYHGYWANQGPVVRIIDGEEGYFPELEELGLDMCWSLADDSVLFVYNTGTCHVKLASEWYPDSTWKYVSPQQVRAEAGDQSGPTNYIYFPPPDMEVGDFNIQDPPGSGRYVVQSLADTHEAGDIIPETHMGYSWLGGFRMYNSGESSGFGADTLFFKIHFKWDSTSGEDSPYIGDIVINPSEYSPPEECISLRDRCLQSLDEQTRDTGPFPTNCTFHILRNNAQAAKGQYDSLTFALGHTWNSESFRLKVFWPGYHTLYFDRMEIYDRAYRHLFYDADRLAKLSTVKTHLVNYDNSVGAVHYNFRIDEPNPRTYLGFQKVYDAYYSSPREISVCLNRDVVNANFLNYVAPDTFFFFHYPLGGDSFQSNRQINPEDPNSVIQTFFTSLSSDVPYATTIPHPLGCGYAPSIYSLQHGWDRFTGSPDHGDEFLWGLYRMREIALSRGKPWCMWLQSGQEVFTHEGTGLTWIGLRDPTLYEIHCMAWLALSYGTDGIGWYRVAGGMTDDTLGVPNDTSNMSCAPRRPERTHGLLDWMRDSTTYGNGPEDYPDATFRKTERFYAAKDIHAMLDTIGPILDGLNWVESNATRAFETNNIFPVHFNGSEPYVMHYSCEKDTGGPHWVGENACSTYVQYTGFIDPSAGINEDYWIMVVNRRCLPNETRRVSFELSELPYAQGKTYVLHHILSGTTYSRTMIHGESQPDYVRTCAIELAPGHGELVHIWGGLIIINVTIHVQGIYAVLTWSPPQGMENPSYIVESSTDNGKTYKTIGETTKATYSDPIASKPSSLYRVVAFEE